MRSHWLWPLLVAALAAAVYVGNVLATPATVPGFSGTTIAKGTYAKIRSHVRQKQPVKWNEEIKTTGASDLYVQQNTWDPGACAGCTPSTGWHTHPGPSLIVVTEGSVTVYDGDDPTCTPQVHTANTPSSAFVDEGGGHVHVIRNETGSVAKTTAVQLIPAGAERRQDAPDPGNCSF
jgi:hypothetical protein